MKNFVQHGAVVSVPAPYQVLSGAGALVGSLFGVAAFDAASGADLELCTTGVYELGKVDAEAWTVGAAVYWDDTAKTCTTVATDNTLIGAALSAGTGPKGLVRLNGMAG